MRIRNTLIIFVVSGFWHGANWTFIVWGALNALFIMPSIIMKTNRKNIETVAEGKLLPTIKEIFQMTITFALIVFSWIFFRAENLGHALQYISAIFSKSLLSIPTVRPSYLALFVVLFVIIEWLGREQQYAIENLHLKLKKPFRYAIYYSIIIAIFWFGGKNQQFIYFQF